MLPDRMLPDVLPSLFAGSTVLYLHFGLSGGTYRVTDKANSTTSRPGLVVWLTGLSCAGKTTIARGVLRELKNRGIASELLDGDEVRKTLSKDLGFSTKDRDENVRRMGFVA